MLNFTYYNPTQIHFGKEQIKVLNDLVPQDAKVLVLYGGGSAKKTGTLDEVTDALGERQVTLFGGIEPNPTYETLMEAVKLIRQESLDFLLAVGGGSVIDGTKFVAAAVNFEGDEWDILKQGGRNVQSALPFGSVLTLPATGSEMNKGGVITRKSTHSKLAFGNDLLFPKFSILDPSKTFTLPEKQVANGVVDAFVHVVEQYLTYPVNAAVQDRFAEGLLQTLIEIGPDAVKNSDDYDTRANLMWVASQALNGLIGAGVPQDWGTHMIGHELTALYGLDHAQTLAIVLPSLLTERKEAKGEKLLQYAERVWQLKEGSDEERIDAAIAKTQDFFESVGVKTRLSDYQLTQENIPSLIESLEANGMTTLGEQREITLEVSRRILERSL